MDVDPPAEVEFAAEQLKLDVEVDVPPSATEATEPEAAETDAEAEDDDTIEQDVDVSRRKSS